MLLQDAVRMMMMVVLPPYVAIVAAQTSTAVTVGVAAIRRAIVLVNKTFDERHDGPAAAFDGCHRRLSITRHDNDVFMSVLLVQVHETLIEISRSISAA